MNKNLYYGRVSTEPALTYLPNGTPKLFFVIGVKRKYKDREGNAIYDNIPCAIIGKLAEIMVPIIEKGCYAALSGQLQTYSITGNDGKRSNGFIVDIEDVTVTSKPADRDNKDPFIEDGKPVDISDELPF